MEHHYSQSVKGATPFLCFEVVHKENLQKQVGAAIFGPPGQAQTDATYSELSSGSQRPKYVCVELRRFVLLEEEGKNSESFILSRILQKLTHLGVDRVISYADPNQLRDSHPDGKHTGLIYRAVGFHFKKEAGPTKAIIMAEDFLEDGKTFKKGRRLPIRNLDQYQNFPVYPTSPDNGLDNLSQQVRLDWLTAARQFDANCKKCKEERQKTGYGCDRHARATRWMARTTGKMVYVIKTEQYLTSLSIRLRHALTTGSAVKEAEDGKILYIKDLHRGMPYFGSPKETKWTK
jgi:hypothetical protein